MHSSSEMFYIMDAINLEIFVDILFSSSHTAFKLCENKTFVKGYDLSMQKPCENHTFKTS